MQNRHSSSAIRGSLKTNIKDDGQWSNGRDIAAWYVLLFAFSFVYPPGRTPRNHLTPIVDSPRTVVPVRTGMRIPGSFGCGDDDEVNELIQGIRELGVKDN
jgi:hypothetical protein